MKQNGKETDMKKTHVDSPEELAQIIRSNYDDLYKLASDIHADAFDLVFSNAIGENEEYLQPLRKKIAKGEKEFAKQLRERYDFDFELTKTDMFNKVIMPATKI